MRELEAAELFPLRYILEHEQRIISRPCEQRAARRELERPDWTCTRLKRAEFLLGGDVPEADDPGPFGSTPAPARKGIACRGQRLAVGREGDQAEVPRNRLERFSVDCIPAIVSGQLANLLAGGRVAEVDHI